MPEALARDIARGVNALDHRQQRDLHRHVALLHFLHDVVQVAAAAVDETLDVVRAARIPLLVLVHERRVERLHEETHADAVPQVRVGHRHVVRILERGRQVGAAKVGRGGRARRDRRGENAGGGRSRRQAGQEVQQSVHRSQLRPCFG
jgi:hypothetical protein